MTYDDWKAREPDSDPIEVPADQCCGDFRGLRCVQDATELVDVAALTGDDTCPNDVPMCSECAEEWRQRGAGENER